VDAVIIAVWAQCNPYYKIWYCGISIVSGRYWHQSFWNWGIFSSPDDQLNIKGIVLYFRIPLRRIKIWIVICYIYSKEKSSSLEANRFSASYEIPCISWNPKVHYQIHKCPPPVHIVS
jgi:hypothetical protein